MQEKQINLSVKEEQKRKFLLTGNIFSVILQIGFPIALFQTLNVLFRLFDSFVATQINTEAASIVAYFSQVNNILSGIGTGFAMGAGILISRAYGKGDYKEVKSRISTMLGISLLMSVFLILAILPFATPFLRAIGTPDVFIDKGQFYFQIEFISTMALFFNSAYLAVERVQGNTKRILKINLLSTVLRLGLTSAGVFLMGQGILFVAFSSLVSQLVIMAVGFWFLIGKSEVFCFSLKAISFKWGFILPMLLISFPIMVERSAFSLGKVMVSSMISQYGPLLVGALGITNLLVLTAISAQSGFQEAAANLIAQSSSRENNDRTAKSAQALFLTNMTHSILLFIPAYVFRYPITSLFAANDPAFHYILVTTYTFDIWSILGFGALTSAMGLLMGLGKTKLTLLINIFRIFLFRIPVLWWLQNFTDVGMEQAGLVMLISNLAGGLLAFIIGLRILSTFKNNQALKQVLPRKTLTCD